MKNKIKAMRANVRLTDVQLYIILDAIRVSKESLILDSFTPIGLYKMYHAVALEKKISRKLLEYPKENYSIKIDLLEAYTLHSVLKKICDDIRVSKIFIELDRYIPRFLTETKEVQHG